MADYASMKVPELKKLLQEKSLSATGNKADLIARLKEHDDAQGNGAAKPTGGAEDEIDWDDEEPAKPAATAPAAEPVAATETSAAAPEASSESTQPVAAPDAEATNGAEAGAPAAAEEPAAPKTDFSAGLAASSADIEAQKRADRAKRFGIVPEDKTDEDKKKADRAARFGAEQEQQESIVKGLDAALPERRERKRGREGAENTGGADRGAKRQQGGGRNDRNRGRHGRRGGGGGNANVNNNSNNKRPSVVADPAEKAKAEARAKRFA